MLKRVVLLTPSVDTREARCGRGPGKEEIRKIMNYSTLVCPGLHHSYQKLLTISYIIFIHMPKKVTLLMLIQCRVCGRCCGRLSTVPDIHSTGTENVSESGSG